MVQQTIIWAVVCLAILGLCIWRPEAGRVTIGVFFIVMGLGVNLVFALVSPSGFVELGTDAALIPWYRWVFEHVVSAAPVAAGAVIAAFEIAVGVLVLLGRRWVSWGLVAGTAFLVLISPLGPWTLPNVVMAAAMIYLLWRRRSRRSTPA